MAYPITRPYRTGNCKCEGTWRQLMRRWVCLERGRTSKLKCLRCGWRWTSKRKYIYKLHDWKEESRSGLTDQDVLDRLLDGTLTIDLETSIVYSWVSNASKKTDNPKPLKPVVRQPKGCGGPYRFVHITRRGKKKKISVHRLVWMASHQSLVPDGFDVDHIHGAAAGDGIRNLRLLPSAVNRATNGCRKLLDAAS
jgi:hypothetical protein